MSRQSPDKVVYFFAKEKCDGDRSMKKLLGGKGVINFLL